MFSHHESLLGRLGNARARLSAIREHELAEAERRIERQEAEIHAEIGETLKTAVLYGVPIGAIREEMGAKNWKAWGRVKERYGILSGDNGQVYEVEGEG